MGQWMKAGFGLMFGLIATNAMAGAKEDKIAKGEMIYREICLACHTVEPGKNRVGPSLYGVVGRKAGTAPGFVYSPGVAALGYVWTADKLSLWLTDPKAAVPDTKMVSPGLKDAELRDAIITFLATKNDTVPNDQ